MGTRTSEVDSILFIRSAERGHSGTYTLSVQIENMLDSADIRIQVVGQSRPRPLLLLRLAHRARFAGLIAYLEAVVGMCDLSEVFIPKRDDNP